MRRFFGDWVDSQAQEAIWASANRDKNCVQLWISQTTEQINRMEAIQSRSTRVLDALGRAHERLVSKNRTGQSHVRIQGR